MSYVHANNFYLDIKQREGWILLYLTLLIRISLYRKGFFYGVYQEINLLFQVDVILGSHSEELRNELLILRAISFKPGFPFKVLSSISPSNFIRVSVARKSSQRPQISLFHIIVTTIFASTSSSLIKLIKKKREYI